MIHKKLQDWQTVPGLANHDIWARAFTWLETAASSASEGMHPLGADGFFARVMSYPLKTREQARYEMHRHTIDIQFTLQGGEAIEVADLDSLKALNDYSESKDVEHFATPDASLARVENLSGYFAILFPGEPHMPQLTTRGMPDVRKVVVKLPIRLLQGTAPGSGRQE